MKKLTKSQLQALVTRFNAVGSTWVEHTDPAFLALLEEEVRLDVPLGELTNPKIAGLVRDWQMLGLSFITGAITDQHQFNAQGLEGAVSIRMRLAMALLTATMVEFDRMDVFVPPAWRGGKYCRVEVAPEGAEEEGG